MKKLICFGATILALTAGAMTAFAAVPEKATISFTVNKEDKETREVSRAYPKVAGTGLEMSEWTCSMDPDEWTAGKMVTFHIIMETVGGNRFDPAITKIEMKQKNATVTKTDITPTHIDAYVDYWPAFVFKNPTNVHMDGDRVKWDAVDGANKYEVSFKREDDEGEMVEETKSTSGVSMNLEKYGYVEDVKVRTVAKDKTESNHTTPSEWSIADDTSEAGPEKPKEEKPQVGKLSTSSAGVTTYTNVDKTKASGWLEVNNNWYYFDPANNNSAMKLQWLEQNGKHYYFDAYGVMMTGQFHDGYHWYYMNENKGSSEYGAMMTGWIHIGDSDYYFNNGSRTDYPYGAMLVDTTTPDGAVVGADGRRIR